MTRPLPLFLLLILCLPAFADENPFDVLTHPWRDDPIWHDGKAEIAEYDAMRTVYGTDRAYTARLMTNREHADPQSKTKDPAGQGRPVFKFHTREDIPTEKYTYHYSTMCYVGSDDLKSLKIDMGSQEDCGATFKQVINHKGQLTWHQFSYFPGEGHTSGLMTPPANLVFHDALPLVLRGYPFEQPRDIPIKLLPDQTGNHLSPTEGFMRPDDYLVSYVGRETLDLPIGTTEAHHLQLRFAGPTREMRPPIDLWFAADGSAPMLHVLVQLQAPAPGISPGTSPGPAPGPAPGHPSRGGHISYQLKSLRREAYWIN